MKTNFAGVLGFIFILACATPAVEDPASFVRAVLVRSHISNLSEMFVSVEMAFSNANKADCKIVEYEVRWKSGLYTAFPKDFHIPANQTVKRSARIYSDSGDLESLHTSKDATVNVKQAICD